MRNQGKIEDADQLSLFAKQKRETVRYPLIANRLQELWHQSFIVEGYASKTDADRARKKGEGLMQRFFAWWKKKERSVIAIEKGFKMHTEHTDITGRFDRVEQSEDGVHVIDFKTGKPQSQQQVDADLQLSIYALAAQESFKAPCTKLTLLFLHEEEFIERRTERSETQLKDAKRRIGTLYNGIHERNFHPTPSAAICKHCPYNGICDAAVI